MPTWPQRLVVLGAVLFLAGWAVVLGWPGNVPGGLMVYGSIPVFLIAGISALARHVRAAPTRSESA